MKHHVIKAALVFLTASCLSLSAQDPNSSLRLDYLSFRIISERNIFNPNRSARITRGEREAERPVRTESFALLGTMSYEKGRFAFFDGTSSEYRKALQTADIIAGYKIAEIAPNHVKLESTNQQAIEMRVGMQMKRQGEEEWQLTVRTESFETSSLSPTSSEKTNSSASVGEEGDVLKRLMQKREEELKNEKP